MATTKSYDISTPLPVLVEQVKKTGQRITLTDDGHPVIDMRPHAASQSGYGLLNAYAPKGISASVEDIKRAIADAATKECRS